MTNEKHCKLYAGTFLVTLRKVERDSSTFLATCSATFCCIACYENGVLHGQLFSQLAMQPLLCCKLQEQLPRVTYPSERLQRYRLDSNSDCWSRTFFRASLLKAETKLQRSPSFILVLWYNVLVRYRGQFWISASLYWNNLPISDNVPVLTPIYILAVTFFSLAPCALTSRLYYDHQIRLLPGTKSPCWRASLLLLFLHWEILNKETSSLTGQSRFVLEAVTFFHPPVWRSLHHVIVSYQRAIIAKYFGTLHIAHVTSTWLL